jgi:hypothetical protein
MKHVGTHQGTKTLKPKANEDKEHDGNESGITN